MIMMLNIYMNKQRIALRIYILLQRQLHGSPKQWLNILKHVYDERAYHTHGPLSLQ